LRRVFLAGLPNGSINADFVKLDYRIMAHSNSANTLICRPASSIQDEESGLPRDVTAPGPLEEHSAMFLDRTASARVLGAPAGRG
jgi:hypothetical protein